MKNIHSVKDAARVIGVTDARIRQICIQLGIGRFLGSTRYLTDADMRRLKATRRRNKKKVRNIA